MTNTENLQGADLSQYQQLNFAESLQAMHTFCVHAQQAARQGRPNAAHGLFQTALIFFEQAQALAESSTEPQCLEAVVLARRELDDYGAAVYSHHHRNCPKELWDGRGKDEQPLL